LLLLAQQHFDAGAQGRVRRTGPVQEGGALGGVVLMQGGDKEVALGHGPSPLGKCAQK
jgi:hypothetical protein